ncbi:MAG: hypothetical protein ABIP95_04710 [Pelobium sp.]
MIKHVGFLVLFFLILPTMAFSQKAFEFVNYIAKTPNLTLKLKLSNGYIAASEIKINIKNSKKTLSFSPEYEVVDDYGKLKFLHYLNPQNTADDYIILEEMKEIF